jgi:ribonucleotide reductase alpha subunit
MSTAQVALRWALWKRTYAREGETNIEHTIDRCLRACETQLKCGFTEQEVAEFRSLLLSYTGSLAGRFLWQLGTETVDRLGLMSLQNCAAMLLDHPVKCYAWLFDALMLGVGVGFNIEQKTIASIEQVRYCDLVHLHEPIIPEEDAQFTFKHVYEKSDYDESATEQDFYYRKDGVWVFVVPDSREGWVRLLTRILRQHFPRDAGLDGDGHPCLVRTFTFNTYQVRPKGLPIKGFGGVSSGHEILVWGLFEINRILNASSGERPTSVNLLDIANLIGHIVVSGNVRRCLRYDTPVWTKRDRVGADDPSQQVTLVLRQIKDVVVGDLVWTHQKRWRPVTAVFKQGSQQCMCLEVGGDDDPANIERLYMTPRHLLYVENVRGDRSWKTAHEVYAAHMVRPGIYRLVSVPFSSNLPQTLPITKFTFDHGAAAECVQTYDIEVAEDSSFAVGEVSCVVVHNSAQIAVGSPDDKAFLDAKRWDSDDVPPYWRSNSNNSVSTFHVGSLDDKFWDLYGGNSEPYGLINLPLCRSAGQVGSETATPKVDPGVVCVNPCVVGDTWTLTKDGPRRVDSLVGKAVTLIVDGVERDTNGFFYTGDKPVHEVKFRNGGSVTATGNHQFLLDNDDWRELHDIKVGDRLMLQQHRRPDRATIEFDGNAHAVGLLMARDGLPSNNDEVETNSLEFQVNVLRGIFESEWTVSDDSCVRFSSKDKNVVQYVYRTLLRVGVFSRCKDTSILLPLYEVVVSGDDNLICLKSLLFRMPTAAKLGDAVLWRTRFVAVVESVAEAGVRPVYDVTVPDVHCFDANGITAHNCAEQPLNNFETCCLAEAFLPNCTSEHEFRRICYFLYRVCKHSLALGCHWPETQAIVHKNMRIGLGVGGYLEATEKQKRWLPETALWLDRLDVVYSRDHGWPCSIKLRTVKPSGSLSLLGGVTAGCHPAFARFYLKRMRVSKEWGDEAKLRGYHVEPVEYTVPDEDTGQPLTRYDERTFVVDFPVTHRACVVTSSQMSAIDQIKVMQRLQADWSDNAVSMTVYYSLKELPAVRRYLEQEFRTGIKGISFLLRQDHNFRQAPWTEISEQEYARRVAEIKRPFGCDQDVASGSHLRAADDDELAENSECAGGSCPRR